MKTLSMCFSCVFDAFFCVFLCISRGFLLVVVRLSCDLLCFFLFSVVLLRLDCGFLVDVLLFQCVLFCFIFRLPTPFSDS